MHTNVLQHFYLMIMIIIIIFIKCTNFPPPLDWRQWPLTPYSEHSASQGGSGISGSGRATTAGSGAAAGGSFSASGGGCVKEIGVGGRILSSKNRLPMSSSMVS